MAYVPQFIPTNTQVLQGTLDQYQKGNDTETARFNQVNDLYSAIPTTNPYDTAKKNEILNNFQKTVIDGLDKKYNYDRSNSQYSRELTSEISKLRSNPHWTLIGERAKVDELRQKLITTKGSSYYENLNPDEITDVNQFKNWKPMDLNDVERQVSINAKEHATSMRKQSLTRPSPGVLQFTNQEGFVDIESATDWLNTDDGQAWLNQSVQGTGFEGYMNDPMVKARAMNAALGQLVGKPDIQRMGDPAWEAAEAERKALLAAALKAGPAWGKVSNMGDIKPYNTKSLSDLQGTKEELNKITSQITDPSISEDQKIALKQRQNELQLDVDRVSDLYDNITSEPNGVKIIETGKNIVRDNVKDVSINVDKAFKTLEGSYINTTSFGRAEIIQPLRGIYENMLSPTSDLISGISQLGMAMFRGILPMNDVKANQKRMQEATISIAKAIGHTKVKVEDKGKIAMAQQLAEEQIKENIVSGKYGDVVNYKSGTKESDLIDKKITQDWKKLFPDFYKVAKEFDNYYQGKGNYVNSGYDQIEKEINNRLTSGEEQVADVYSPPIDITPADLKQVPTFITNNLDAFEVRTSGGKDKPLTEKEVTAINGLFTTKEGGDKSGISVKVAINPESDPTLILKAPTGEKFQLKMNIAKMSDDAARQLVSITKLPQIMDIRYKDINFANKTYTLNDNYLKNIFSQRYSDLEPFNGMSLTRSEDNKIVSYSVTLPQFKELYGSETVVFNTKYGLMSTLDELYRDYISTKNKV